MKRYLAIAVCLFICSAAVLANVRKTFISSKSDDGAVLKMGDGSVWVVDEVDRVDSSVWLAADSVIIDDDSNSCAHVQIINTDEDDEAVCAKEVK